MPFYSIPPTFQAETIILLRIIFISSIACSNWSTTRPSEVSHFSIVFRIPDQGPHLRQPIHSRFLSCSHFRYAMLVLPHEPKKFVYDRGPVYFFSWSLPENHRSGGSHFDVQKQRKSQFPSISLLYTSSSRILLSRSSTSPLRVGETVLETCDYGAPIFLKWPLVDL